MRVKFTATRSVIAWSIANKWLVSGESYLANADGENRGLHKLSDEFDSYYDEAVHRPDLANEWEDYEGPRIRKAILSDAVNVAKRRLMDGDFPHVLNYIKTNWSKK
jgi:hypothetical protein